MNAIMDFAKGLQLPQEILDSLYKERTNVELEVYAKTLPQLLYPDTYKLAGRLYIYLNIKSAPKSMKDYVAILDGVLQTYMKTFILENHKALDELLQETYEKNFDYDIMSASACVNYLLRLSPEEESIETPCHLYLRQAIQFYHDEGMQQVEKCYREFLDKKYVHASPTMFNAGTRKNQMSSCFLLTIGDNLESLLYTGVGDVGMISKAQGGIGLSLSAVRHSSIANTGNSSGVLPFAKIYDAAIACVDQGGKRNGAMTITLIDWHIDFLEFVQCRDNYTQNGIRLKQANICAYLSSEFMRRVRTNGKWTLFCPSRAVMNIDGKEIKLLGQHSHYFDKYYPLFEAEALRRDEEYNQLDVYVQSLEKTVNSGLASEEQILEYHNMVMKRTKMRKNLIVHKVVQAVDVYDKLCDMHIKSSMPYIVYRDTVNYKNNMKNLGTVEGLNLCVAPETFVLTDEGHKPIVELENKIVNVWNGKEFSKVTVKQTNVNQELVKVKFTDGSELECTPYHRFYIQTKYPTGKLKSDILKSANVKVVEAKDLTPDMKLVKCSYPIIDKGEDMKNAYTAGFFTGDGTYMKYPNEEKRCSYKSQEGKAYCKRHICYEQDDDKETEICQGLCYTDKPLVTLYGEKTSLVDKLAYRTIGTEQNNRVTLTLDVNIADKFVVPLNNSLKSKLKWFAGYADADGCIVLNGSNQSLQVSSIDEEFLKNVKFMLQTCGCNPKISLCTEAGNKELPDGNGGVKEYNCKTLYRMCLSSFDLQTLLHNGFSTHRLIINKEHVQRSACQYNNPVEVIKTGRFSDTYCFTEPLRNAGIFNGVFTSQCLEITEPSTPDAIASCNLAHVNLKRFVLQEYNDGKDIKDCYNFTELGDACRSLVRNLNKVIEFNRYPLDKFDKEGNVTQRGKISLPNLANRPLGIGVSGLAEVFANLTIAYDSQEAYKVNKMIFACMYYNCLLESFNISKSNEQKSGWKENGSYKSFEDNSFEAYIDGKWSSFIGCPLNNGFFQFDMWKQEADYLRSIDGLNEKIYNSEDDTPVDPSEWGQHGSWEELRKSILRYGVYNSMFLAPMPTASSAQMLNNAETTEAHQTLMYSRKLAHGNYTSFSEPFIKDMVKYGLWSQEVIDFIMLCNGTIKDIDKFFMEYKHLIPQYIQNDKLNPELVKILDYLKKTHRGMYEISQKVCMKMARQRGIYIDQSQSLNIYLPEPNMRQVKAIHDYSECLRLKTGMYYLRANPSSQTDRFTTSIDIQQFHNKLYGEPEEEEQAPSLPEKQNKQVICTDDVCIMCQ